MKRNKKKDNRGLSLLETICAVAIFSLIALTIGSVVVVSAKSYQKGVTETSIQQEAQFAANRISGIVQDASKAEYHSDTEQLIMETNDGIASVISYVDNKLYYTDNSDAGTQLGNQLLAENITGFEADTGDFAVSRTVKLMIQVEDNGKTYNMNYTVTARNQAAGNIEEVDVPDTVGIWIEDGIILVPGETYEIPISVIGKVTMGMDASTSSGNLEIRSVSMDNIEVAVDKNAIDSDMKLKVFTKDTDNTGAAKGSVEITVKIRRVTAVQVVHAVNRSKTANGALEDKNAEYTFYADVTGSNLNKRLGASWDREYKKAQAVSWSAVLTLNGSEIPVSDYFTEVSRNEDVDRPSITYRLEQNMPSGLELTVTANSKHAAGVNKAGSVYDDISASDSISPRATKINTATEMTLEPNEIATFKLNMKGGASTVNCVLRDTSDASTKAEYDATNDNIVITVGNDEKGVDLGYDSTKMCEQYNYTFYVDVYLNADTTPKTTLTVHVRRIDVISLEVKDDWYNDETNELMGEVAYQFIVRFNVGNGKKDDTAMKYLIDDMDRAPDAMSILFKWELIDNTTNKVKCTDSVICKGDGTLVEKNYKKEQDYYTVSDVKASIKKDADGNVKVSLPHINIHAKEETGLPDNTELRVTAVAMHAESGTYNKGKKSYGHVEAVASVKGKQVVEIATDPVIVEPGQGTNVRTDMEHEMVIPISVMGGAVYRMEAKLEGNSDPDTRLAVYDELDSNGSQLTNPYFNGNANSSNNNQRTWWLGLLIGEDEKGRDDTGLIDLTIKAYNSRNGLVATDSVKIALRRVTSVDIAVSDNKNINDLNLAGNTITLQAMAKGYGEGGTQYFAMQQKEDGSPCRWESKGHGEYKTPYPVKWTMYYNGKETDLDKLSDYIDTTSIKTNLQEEYGRDTITFTLKQPLPKGAEIRAVSLHALGTDQNVTYNKSGKKYGTVYGKLRIGESGGKPISINFQRGHDGNWFDAQFPNHRGEYNGAQQRGFYRYREKDGAWSQYYKLTDNSETPSKFDYNESSIFDPDKEYDVEVIVAVYSESTKTLYWPHDSSLLEAGNGWKEAGIVNKGWTGSDDTDVSEYKRCFSLGKSEIYFKENTTYGVKEGDRTFGKYDGTSPVALKPGDTLTVSLGMTYFSFENKQNYFKAYIQKQVNDKWVDAQPSDWSIQTECPQFKISSDGNNHPTGKYRIGVVLKDIDWKKVSGNIFSPVYTSEKRTFPLYDFDTGVGVVYFQFN